MKASDYIIDYLYQNQITKVFGYIGGSIAHLIDSLYNCQTVEMVNTIHEQGAGFAAEGYARTTYKTGVAIATSGPGATNLITPLGSCFFDSVPCLFITGQVNTYEYKYDKPVRQIGFQETDIVSIVKPITKYAVMVSNAHWLRYELEKCLFISQNGRKGPVLLDIPMDIQRAEIEVETSPSFFDSDEYKAMLKDQEPDLSKINDVIKLIRESQRPIFLLGGGVRLSKAFDILNTFLKKTQIPTVTSLMGVDAVSGDYTYNAGLIGAYGNRYGNFSIANSDLLIVLGSRLDSRQTGTDLKSFAREAKIIQVDIDAYELEHKDLGDIKIKMEIKTFIEELQKHEYHLNLQSWHSKIEDYKIKYPSISGIDGIVKPQNQIIESIFDELRENDLVSVDVGQHQMWVAQSAKIKEGQRILFSGGMGSMGFALPSAIGTAIATGQRSIVIVGDGGFQMNIQELEILHRRNLPIKIIVLNNASLGMVRQFQEIYFEERYASTVEDYSVPDYEAITQAYKLKAQTVKVGDILQSNSNILKDFLSDESPGLLNVLTHKFTAVEPKLIVNNPIENMHPFLEKDELEENMLIDLYSSD